MPRKYLYTTAADTGYGVVKSVFSQEAVSMLKKMKTLTDEELIDALGSLVGKKSLYDEPRNNVSGDDKDALIAELTYQLLDMKYRYNDAKQSLANANGIIADLQANCCDCHDGTRFTMMKIDLTQNTSIKEEYILYIVRHGMPDDGLFLPSLLQQIKYELGLL